MDLVAGSNTNNFPPACRGRQILVRSGNYARLRDHRTQAPGALRDLPAVAEVLPGFEVVGWYCVIAGHLPKPDRHPRTRSSCGFSATRGCASGSSGGSEPIGSTPEEFRQFMLADLAKWAKLVKQSAGEAGLMARESYRGVCAPNR